MQTPKKDRRDLPAAAATAGWKMFPALAVIVFAGAQHAALFGNADYQLAARRLLAGENFYGIINYDERSFQAMIADGMKGRPLEVLVAGSSRTMQLEGDCFEGPSYNASVSGAEVADDAAAVEVFRRGRTLRHVVFAADPWILSGLARSTITRADRMPSAPDWIRAQLRLGLIPGGLDVIAAARAGLEPFRAVLAPGSWTRTVDRPALLNNLFRKEPDGSLRYPDFFVNVTEAAAADEARKAADLHLKKVYTDFTRIDPFLARAFEALTADLKANGARVTLVLCPFHPEYYQRVTNEGGGKMVPLVEAYFRGLAKREGYQIIGAYDPAVTGNPASDFFDGVHMKKAALKRMFGCRAGPRP